MSHRLRPAATRARSWLSLSVVVTAMAAATCMALSSAASADSGAFSCRASALRVTGVGLVNVEPTVANSASAPCASAANTNVVLPQVLTPLLAVGATNVATSAQTASASASVSVADTTVAAAIGGGLRATALQASAGYACSAGTRVPSGSSQVVGLTFQGTPVALDQNGHASLLGLGDVYVDQTITGSGSVTRRALTVQLLPTVDGGATLVLGEASAGATTGACDSPSGSGGSGGSGSGSGSSGPVTGPQSGNCATAAGCFTNLGPGSGTGQGSGSGVTYVTGPAYQLGVGSLPGVSYTCAIDAGRFNACAPPFRFHLRDGAHTIRLRGTDHNGHSFTATFHIFVDSKAPRSGLLYPLCRNTTHGRTSAKSTVRCASIARNWRVLRGRVTDPTPSSGIAKVGVNLVQRRGHACRVLDAHRRFATMSCANASHLFVSARIGARGFGRQTLTHTTCKHGRHRACNQRGVRVQVANWSLTVPIGTGRWQLRVTAADRAGNQQVKFTGRSHLSLHLY